MKKILLITMLLSVVYSQKTIITTGSKSAVGAGEDCHDCEYDFTPYGSECCDSAWYEYGIDCATLEANYSWDCSGCACPDVSGCTNPEACNYDPEATYDDGSCEITVWYPDTDGDGLGCEYSFWALSNEGESCSSECAIYNAECIIPYDLPEINIFDIESELGIDCSNYYTWDYSNIGWGQCTDYDCCDGKCVDGCIYGGPMIEDCNGTYGGYSLFCMCSYDIVIESCSQPGEGYVDNNLDTEPQCGYDDPCHEGYDECGVCGGNGPEENYDCAGNCIVEIDCAGDCAGSAEVDECGECNGDGIDCNGDGIPDDCEEVYTAGLEEGILLGGQGGDSNGDGELNILDIVYFVDVILNP